MEGGECVRRGGVFGRWKVLDEGGRVVRRLAAGWEAESACVMSTMSERDVAYLARRG